jgi:hypothetical protein
MRMQERQAVVHRVAERNVSHPMNVVHSDADPLLLLLHAAALLLQSYSGARLSLVGGQRRKN